MTAKATTVDASLNARWEEIQKVWDEIPQSTVDGFINELRKKVQTSRSCPCWLHPVLDLIPNFQILN